jgi:hypothetical protein
MVAIWSFETPVGFRRTTWRYIPDDRNLHKYEYVLDLSKILRIFQLVLKITSLFDPYPFHLDSLTPNISLPTWDAFPTMNKHLNTPYVFYALHPSAVQMLSSV